ncbi:MAG TPA: hypothetical protein VFY69_00090 [Solirubrobacterales bacterium]|nr:hypothetical protein [Solirubrobacterales bacterium]
MLVVAILIVLLVKGLYPADLPESRNPDFVDNIFDNRGVLWAARLLLISGAAVLAFGGVFIAVSIGVRMKNQEWLRRAGPFEISEESVDQAKEEVSFWHRVAQTNHEEAENLRKRLRRSEELIESFKGVR